MENSACACVFVIPQIDRKQQEDARAAAERDPEFVMTYDDSYLAQQYGDDDDDSSGQQQANGRRGGHDEDDDDEALPRGGSGRRRRAPPRDRDTGRRGRNRSRSPVARRGGRYE